MPLEIHQILPITWKSITLLYIYTYTTSSSALQDIYAQA